VLRSRYHGALIVTAALAGRRRQCHATPQSPPEPLMSFKDQVVIVTGAGSGLGRAHALGFAARGARVLVNDLGADGVPSANARAVVAEIEEAGGCALADGADVGDPAAAQAAVDRALQAWGRVDVLVANAGILQDKSFAKMTSESFAQVVRVHLLGSANFARAVWAPMRAQNYGRIVFTSSASGLYGNFGQANYGAAKTALVGLMNVLHLEGEKSNIRVNTLVPIAATAMTRDLLPEAALSRLAPECVTPAVLFLAGKDGPSRVIMSAGAGVFNVTHIQEGPGVFLPESRRTPEDIAAHFAQIASSADLAPVEGAFQQTQKFLALAIAADETAGR
jgi:NAD(P)-dependent dehydrogenase (short-subunit alcohol dehydrogenase family)